MTGAATLPQRVWCHLVAYGEDYLGNISASLGAPHGSCCAALKSLVGRGYVTIEYTAPALGGRPGGRARIYYAAVPGCMPPARAHRPEVAPADGSDPDPLRLELAALALEVRADYAIADAQIIDAIYLNAPVPGL